MWYCVNDTAVCEAVPVWHCSWDDVSVPYILMYRRKDVVSCDEAGPSHFADMGVEEVCLEQISGVQSTLKSSAERVKRFRSKQSDGAKRDAKERNRVQKAAARAGFTGEQREEATEANTVRMADARAAFTDEQRKEAKEANKVQMTAARAARTEEAMVFIRAIDCERKRREKERKEHDAKARISLFKDSVKLGRIFECLCCHRRLFRAGMKKIEDLLVYRESLENRNFPGLYELAIGDVANPLTRRSPDAVYGAYHLCSTCYASLNKGKMPPMCHNNNLGLYDISAHPELHLSEVEHSLIALNLVFQKIYQLPKSRWPAMKDKTINIPVYDSDVLQTIQSLPRTPTEAGIIPVKLKRKVAYKNAHKYEYVSVSKVVAALHTLMVLGHKYYHFVST